MNPVEDTYPFCLLMYQDWHKKLFNMPRHNRLSLPMTYKLLSMNSGTFNTLPSLISFTLVVNIHVGPYEWWKVHQEVLWSSQCISPVSREYLHAEQVHVEPLQMQYCSLKYLMSNMRAPVLESVIKIRHQCRALLNGSALPLPHLPSINPKAIIKDLALNS